MFNHHFFEEDFGKLLLESFFEKAIPQSVAVVLDPPFGGLVQVLACTIRKIWRFSCFNVKHKCKCIYFRLHELHEGFQDSFFSFSFSIYDFNCKDVELPTFWIFPYFMETHILKELPSFMMCDYKVRSTEIPTEVKLNRERLLCVQFLIHFYRIMKILNHYQWYTLPNRPADLDLHFFYKEIK